MAHPTRPVIGINADFFAATKKTIAHARLNAGYFDSIFAAGGLPIIFPPLGKDQELKALLDQVDGVILSGGLDLDPRRQQQPSHTSVQPMAERREANDRALLRLIMGRQLPILAIGVGMQLVNVLCGGSLYLHLPHDLPRAMPHKDPFGEPHRHAVVLQPHSRLEEIYGGGEILVNSDHHQAVHEVGANLRVAAKSHDGVIEAIEAEDPNWFCIGVQWHPESETASALDMQLFECFLQACVRQSEPLTLAA
jgi:putative glutamine amidotransferase